MKFFFRERVTCDKYYSIEIDENDDNIKEILQSDISKDEKVDRIRDYYNYENSVWDFDYEEETIDESEQLDFELDCYNDIPKFVEEFETDDTEFGSIL